MDVFYGNESRSTDWFNSGWFIDKNGQDKSKGKIELQHHLVMKLFSLPENHLMQFHFAIQSPELWAWRILIKLAKRKMSDNNE